jgi:UDP-N-acetylglucosamine--N-acetylmuramyl-(pentapeptide) pyrophosphoryl-undecaprenol N-acetylglucosamine transferase
VGAVNRPAIFVPYPFQQGTHQTDNAKALAAVGKALVVEETQPEFGRRLRDTLAGLLDRDAYRAMKSAPFEPRGLEAATKIAEGIVTLAGARG